MDYDSLVILAQGGDEGISQGNTVFSFEAARQNIQRFIRFLDMQCKRLNKPYTFQGFSFTSLLFGDIEYFRETDEGDVDGNISLFSFYQEALNNFGAFLVFNEGKEGRGVEDINFVTQ